jgi:hypothetical protein
MVGTTIMNITAVKTIRRYKSILTTFFGYLHKKKYEKNHEFTDEQLRDVTHNQVMEWLTYQCFGTVNPVYDDKLKLRYRKQTVLYWKKALSHYLTNEQTRSESMNKFMKYIGLLQVRKRGPPSMTRATLDNAGFQHLIQGLKKEHKNDKKNDGKSHYRTQVRKYGVPAMLCYQFSMIGRIDDCTQVLAENLQCYDRFPLYALKSKMTWSKNVMDERDAPWQILLGSMLSLYCVFVNVGIWLEIQLEKTPGAQMSPFLFSFSNDYSIPAGGKKALTTASRMISEVFSDTFYEKCNVGTHSIRKFANTHCRNCGISKDDVESRGRWRDGRRVSNRYEDPTLPFVDVQACHALCQGGACTYVAKPGCVTQEFLCSYVVPGIATKFGANVAIVLGSAVMWTIFSSHSDMVPEVIRSRVVQAYNALSNKLPNGENPIEQRELVVAGEGHNFTLVNGSINQQDQSPTTSVRAHGPVGGSTGTAILHAAMNQLTEVRQSQVEVKEALAQHQKRVDDHMNKIHKTLSTELRKISRRPDRMLQHAAAAANATVNVPPVNVPPNMIAPLSVVAHPESNEQMDMGLAHHAAGLHATLSPQPANLYVLCQEYYIGIDGRKPTKDFSRKERGGSQKVTFCRRKKFWLIVDRLVRSGHSADEACKMIYDAYGHGETVTSILTRISNDLSNHTLPMSIR